MSKKTKSFIGSQMGTGVGLMVGSTLFSKLGSQGGATGTKIANTGQGALNLASISMTVGGAKHAMDSLTDLTKQKKPTKKRK